MIEFESLGYKDITKDKPILFIECLGEFFDSTYPYSKRFYKQEGSLTIELKVGNCHSICFISGVCYYSKGHENFEICAPEKCIVERFEQIINAVKQVIKDKLSNETRNDRNS